MSAPLTEKLFLTMPLANYVDGFLHNRRGYSQVQIFRRSSSKACSHLRNFGGGVGVGGGEGERRREDND